MSGLPRSISSIGYQTYDAFMNRRRLMIGTEGPTDSGKTEFLLSSPGPAAHICIDRNFEACIQNPNPPVARRRDHGFKVINIPMSGAARPEDYMEYWKNFRKEFHGILSINDIRTVGLDGDSDSWELQRLAAFGKLTQIPSIMYTDVNAARRALIAKAHDSGKNVIATNKVKETYVDKIDLKTGQVVLNKDGTPIRVPSGEYDRQGFGDTDYLWHVQLRHLVKKGGQRVIKAGPRAGETISIAPEFGIRILKCKSRMELEGAELWGDKCNFAGLVKFIWPMVELRDWGL